MHVLGASFSQRRKSSKRPRDLDIRKVSLSGSSLASACSFSSTASTTSTGTFGQRSTDSAVAFDPLHLHPTYGVAPPRLSERPYASKYRSSRSPRWEEAVSYFDDDSSDDEEEEDSYDDTDDDTLTEEDMSDGGVVIGEDKERFMPPHASPLDHAELDGSPPQDYFLRQLAKRPPMPRSQWSESTVHTVGTLESESSVATPVQLVGIPNFSYKRVTVHRRPPVKMADSPDNFVKRGGWKRRGIVFHQDEVRVDEQEQQDYTFSV